jgi:hypothetical protein
MFTAIERVRSWRTSKLTEMLFAGTILVGGAVLAAPSVAYAKSGTNTFTFMTSGTDTYHGSTSSVDLKGEYHVIGSTTYGGAATVKGSWNCPNGLNLS